MQKQKSPIWLFYNKDEATTVLNSKQITQNYSLMKGDKVCNTYICICNICNNLLLKCIIFDNINHIFLG